MLTLNLRRPPKWRSLYELESITVAMLCGFVPFVGTAMEMFGSSFLIPAASIYGGVLLFVQRRAIDWKCPRCGRAFLRRRNSGFALPFRSKWRNVWATTGRDGRLCTTLNRRSRIAQANRFEVSLLMKLKRVLVSVVKHDVHVESFSSSVGELSASLLDTGKKMVYRKNVPSQATPGERRHSRASKAA